DDARLAGLLTLQTAEEEQAVAIANLGQRRDPGAAAVLIAGWKRFTPALRSLTLDVLARRPEWTAALLEAMERKQIPTSEIDTIRRQRLLEHKTAALASRAKNLFTDLINPDRKKIINGYHAALGLTGHAERGLQVFAKHCAACHRLGSVGAPVGPDL